MRIVMMTNTYLPYVGGVAQSVARFAGAYRKQGHDVLVVAPEFEGQPENEEDVLRVPAIQHFNGSDFSVALPVPLWLKHRLDQFQPDIVHSHHPFLLGDTALRSTAARQLPLVFTHHTMYEEYTHYVPIDAPALAKSVVTLATGYANLCEHVVAPSQRIERILRERGVERPITTIPTGVDTGRFQPAGGAEFRRKRGIPEEAFVVGHVGRLAPEKNLDVLARAAAAFLDMHADAHLVVTGDGPSRQLMEAVFSEAGADARTHFTGRLSGDGLIAAYSAMDVFFFTSKSETQGMVLVEAMAVGKPVVALNAPPVDEVVVDTRNGRLIDSETPEALARGLASVREQDEEGRHALSEGALETAREFDTHRCAKRALDLYAEVAERYRKREPFDEAGWAALRERIEDEWQLWNNRLAAAKAALEKE